LKETICWKP